MPRRPGGSNPQEKRLAKAEEHLARREGRDPAPFKAAWQAKVAEEKRLPATPRAELTGDDP